MPTRRRPVDAARGAGERVLVFGDFDADGLTGLAILVLALRHLGLDGRARTCPSRLEEGHGLSLAAVEAAERAGATLIVTVDYGLHQRAPRSARRWRAGSTSSSPTIISVPAVLPPAAGHRQPASRRRRYPDPRLAGSGVAFKVAQLLLRDRAVPGRPGPGGPRGHRDGRGRGARSSARTGPSPGSAWSGMRRGPRPGLAALLERAGSPRRTSTSRPSRSPSRPRLNAAGRVGEAFDAARLLLADDPAEAAASPTCSRRPT